LHDLDRQIGTAMNEPEAYEIRVAGHLGKHWEARFQPLRLQHVPGGETVLTGMLDQAALHGVLLQIRDLGLKIVSVQSIGSGHAKEEDNE
jgi:hypothetical protein